MINLYTIKAEVIFKYPGISWPEKKTMAYHINDVNNVRDAKARFEDHIHHINENKDPESITFNYLEIITTI